MGVGHLDGERCLLHFERHDPAPAELQQLDVHAWNGARLPRNLSVESEHAILAYIEHVFGERQRQPPCSVPRDPDVTRAGEPEEGPGRAEGLGAPAPLRAPKSRLPLQRARSGQHGVAADVNLVRDRQAQRAYRQGRRRRLAETRQHEGQQRHGRGLDRLRRGITEQRRFVPHLRCGRGGTDGRGRRQRGRQRDWCPDARHLGRVARIAAPEKPGPLPLGLGGPPHPGGRCGGGEVDPAALASRRQPAHVRTAARARGGVALAGVGPALLQLRDVPEMKRRGSRAPNRGGMLELRGQRILLGAAKRGGRFHHLPLFRVRVAEVAPGPLVARRQPHRHLELRQRLVDPP